MHNANKILTEMLRVYNFSSTGQGTKACQFLGFDPSPNSKPSVSDTIYFIALAQQAEDITRRQKER